MKREITQVLIDWKGRINRKPLIVRGARQVGKTFTINEFGDKHFANKVILNLEEKPEFREIFKNSHIPTIIQELSILTKTDIVPGKTLVFIDEIQACPEAIVLLRYFYEQVPELHIIAAGSLLDHTLNEAKLSMPVGRIEFYYMFPMNFREFLWAMAEEKIAGYIDEYSIEKPFSEPIHNRILELIRYYFFIGGMPEAIKTFIETGKLLEVERIHHSILTSLQFDFAKYGTKTQQAYLNKVFHYTALNPGKKIKYVNIDKDIKSTYLKEAFYKLELSRVIHLVKHTSSAKVPLTNNMNHDIFKAYFYDIGLVNHLSKIQLIEPEKITTINEGALAEQFVAQELLSTQAIRDPQLFYWIREEKNSNAEIDFICQFNNEIYPVEVKSGKTGTLKSLHVYLSEKKLQFGVRLNTDLPSITEFTTKVKHSFSNEEISFKLLSLPIYMTSNISKLLKTEQ